MKKSALMVMVVTGTMAAVLGGCGDSFKGVVDKVLPGQKDDYILTPPLHPDPARSDAAVMEGLRKAREREAAEAAAQNKVSGAKGE